MTGYFLRLTSPHLSTIDILSFIFIYHRLASTSTCRDRWTNLGYLAIFIAVFQCLGFLAIRYIRHIRR